MNSDNSHSQLVLITGLAGAGSSLALNTLQDVGFLAVDNLPLALMSQLVSTQVETAHRRVAVSIDGRSPGFDAKHFTTLIADIRARLESRVTMLFLTATTDALARRFNATRRHHPLNTTGQSDELMKALALDWEQMAPLEKLADVHIDTTHTTPDDLRRAVLNSIGEGEAKPIPIILQSFSYRQGIPPDADMVLDMRFIDNPHWVEGLAEKTGLDAEVQDYIKKSPLFNRHIEQIKMLLAESLPHFSASGRPQFSMAIGCTGGRHRSVCAVVTLATMLEEMGHQIRVHHRDLP